VTAGAVPAADRMTHWEHVYGTRAPTEVSWFEPEPAVSLRLIESVAPSHDSALIDVGGGASLLVDRLLTRGFRDVTVLDVSPQALDQVRRRLGRAAEVTLVAHGVLTWQPSRRYHVWHDRAVFHFLVDGAERERYVDLATRTVRVGGALVLGTFALDGPCECSGLPVARYAPDELAGLFGGAFTATHDERAVHVTPWGAVQPFSWIVLRRDT